MKPEIIYLPIGNIKVNPDNPRLIRDAKFKSLVKSLKDCPSLFDARPCICSDRTGNLVIMGGNMRYLAAKELKYSEVPVIVMPGLTEAQEREIVVKDNGAFGEWDFDLLSGWSDLPLTDWGIDLPDDWLKQPETKHDAEPITNRALELNEKWKVSKGDLWKIADHLILCGDSTNDKDVCRLLKTQKPNIMVTDPPYGVEYDANWRNEVDRVNGLPYGGRAIGKVTNDNRSKWCGTYIRSNAPVAYIWHASLFSIEVAMDLKECGYGLRSIIIWAKKRFVISRGDYHWAHETCLYAVKNGETGGYCGGRKQSTLWADITDNFNPKSDDPLYATKIDQDNIYCFPASSTTVWSLKNDKMCDGGHSTQKPLECMSRPIRKHGMPGDIVYDPFLGSGTTLIACENLKRRCFGVEIAPEYVAVCLQRFEDAFGIKGARAD